MGTLEAMGTLGTQWLWGYGDGGGYGGIDDSVVMGLWGQRGSGDIGDTAAVGLSTS